MISDIMIETLKEEYKELIIQDKKQREKLLQNKELYAEHIITQRNLSDKLFTEKMNEICIDLNQSTDLIDEMTEKLRQIDPNIGDLLLLQFE